MLKIIANLFFIGHYQVVVRGRRNSWIMLMLYLPLSLFCFGFALIFNDKLLAVKQLALNVKTKYNEREVVAICEFAIMGVNLLWWGIVYIGVMCMFLAILNFLIYRYSSSKF